MTFDGGFAADSEITGYFDCLVQCDPSDNTGKESIEISFENMGLGVKTLYYHPINKEPQITKKVEKVSGDGANAVYKCTTTVVPGNTKSGSLPLVDTLTDFVLDESQGVQWGTSDSMKTLTKGSTAGGSTYTYSDTKADGTNGSNTYTGTIRYDINFDELTNEDAEYTFVYYVKMSDDVLNRTTQSTMTSLSTLYAGGGSDVLGDKITDTKESTEKNKVTYVAKWITQDYEIDFNKKEITWTIEINEPGINMYNTWFYIANNDKYLEDPENITVTGDTTSSNKWTEQQEKSYTVGSTTYTMGYGIGDGAGVGYHIGEKKTITYTTKIKDEYFTTNVSNHVFDTKVALSWDYASDGTQPGTPVSGIWTGEQKKSFSNSLAKKVAASYDSSTGIITWKVTINESKATLSDVRITDVIPEGQTFDNTTYKVKDGNGDAYSYYDYSASNKTLYITATKEFSDAKTFTFQTKIDDSYRVKNGTKTTFENGIYVTGTGIDENGIKTSGSKDITPNLIKKDSSYDQSTKTIHWTLTVNADKANELKDVQIVDSFEKGLTYTKGTFKVDGEVPSTDISVSDNQFTYSAADTDVAGKTLVLTYDTEITDLTLFHANQSKDLQNEAKMTYKISDTQGEATVTKKQNVKVSVIEKDTVDYKKGKSYVDYKVTFNEDFLTLNSAKIVDIYTVTGANASDVSVDLSTVKMTAYSSDGTEKEVSLTYGTDYTYNQETGTLTVNIPNGGSDKYELTYRLKRVNQDANGFTIENKATLTFPDGSRADESATKSVKIETASAGFEGEDFSKVIIAVTDKDDPKSVIPGAKVEVYDEYGVKAGEGTTDEEGKVTIFGLNNHTKYTVKTIKPGENYMYDKEETTSVETGAGGSETDVTLQEEKASRDITFVAITDGGRKLEGIVYQLVDKDGNVVDEVTSDAEGKVVFKKVPTGSYEIVEKTTENNKYVKDTETKLTVTVAQDTDTYEVSATIAFESHKDGSFTVYEADKDELIYSGDDVNVIEEENGNTDDTTTPADTNDATEESDDSEKTSAASGKDAGKVKTADTTPIIPLGAACTLSAICAAYILGKKQET